MFVPQSLLAKLIAKDRFRSEGPTKFYGKLVVEFRGDVIKLCTNPEVCT